jgi:hypothetical protein
MNNLPRFIGLTMLGILLAGGVLSSFYVHSIEAALTIPSNVRGAPTSTIAPTTTVITPAAAVTTVTANILVEDTFQRVDRLFWGTSSDGHPWGADAQTKKVFSIAGKAGQVANGQGTFDATIGPIIADAEVEFSGSMSQFAQSNLGAVLRWNDANDWYKSYIDGKSLVVLKRVGGMATRLGAIPFTARAGMLYTVRFRVVGTTLSARVWQTGNAEPTNWLVTVTDNTFQNGYGGLRLLLENGTVATITTFKETAVTANA